MIENFRVKTIQQYKILEFLESNFAEGTFVDLHLISRCELLAINTEGKKALLTWKSR